MPPGNFFFSSIAMLQLYTWLGEPKPGIRATAATSHTRIDHQRHKGTCSLGSARKTSPALPLHLYSSTTACRAVKSLLNLMFDVGRCTRHSTVPLRGSLDRCGLRITAASRIQRMEQRFPSIGLVRRLSTAVANATFTPQT